MCDTHRLHKVLINGLTHTRHTAALSLSPSEPNLTTEIKNWKLNFSQLCHHEHAFSWLSWWWSQSLDYVRKVSAIRLYDVMSLTMLCVVETFLFSQINHLFFFCFRLQSVIMLMFREEKSPEDEIKAWQFWHSRQHSVKQRILDAGKFFCMMKFSLVTRRRRRLNKKKDIFTMMMAWWPYLLRFGMNETSPNSSQVRTHHMTFYASHYEFLRLWIERVLRKRTSSRIQRHNILHCKVLINSNCQLPDASTWDSCATCLHNHQQADEYEHSA